MYVCRNPVGGESAASDWRCGNLQQVFIGEGVFIDGARPDVAAAFPTYPRFTRGGWGFMVLTNMLPAQGNGTYTLQAYAIDRELHTTPIATRTITCNNAQATRPFGAIDTPTQGGTASGANYLNFGWALTPHAEDHSDGRLDDHGVRRRRVDGTPDVQQLPIRHREPVPRLQQHQRGGRVQGDRHDGPCERSPHDRVDRHRQPGLDAGHREPVFQRGERVRGDDGRRDRRNGRSGVHRGAAGRCVTARGPPGMGCRRAVAGVPGEQLRTDGRPGRGSRPPRAASRIAGRGRDLRGIPEHRERSVRRCRSARGSIPPPESSSGRRASASSARTT